MGDLVDGLFGGGGDPDYTRLYREVDETKQVSNTLGEQQIADARADAERAALFTDPLADRQLALMDQAQAQGSDTYNYLKTLQRPLEGALQTEAMAAGSDARQEEAAGRAVADARQGTTAAQNRLIRQGLRYGMTPNSININGTAMSVGQGLAEATAANGARTAERDSGFAKKLDVQRVLAPQAAQVTAAQNTALSAGTASANTKLAPIAIKQTGVKQGTDTILSGRQMALNGVSNAVRTSSSGGGGGGGSGLGQVAGAALGAWASTGFAWSDRRLKRCIRRVGSTPGGAQLYAFKYLWSDQEIVGVMADEVPHAAIDVGGFQMVNYRMVA